MGFYSYQAPFFFLVKKLKQANNTVHNRINPTYQKNCDSVSVLLGLGVKKPISFQLTDRGSDYTDLVAFHSPGVSKEGFVVPGEIMWVHKSANG